MIKQILRFKLEILILLGVLSLYFVLRLPNLTLQPIFADEAIYVRWAQVMRAEPTLRFLPLSDGKTPLFMWLMIPFFKIFSDPLFAGRFLSVLSGFLTLLGVLFLGWKFFTPRVGILAALLVAVTPYMVFYDRMALVDSMLAAFSIWVLSLSLLLVKYPRFDLAMVLGYLLGGSILVKPPGMFNLFLIPVTLLLTDFKIKKLLRIGLMFVVAVIISQAIFNILRLGPGFSSLNSRNQDYIFSLSELSGRYHDPFIPHLYDLIDWLPKNLTIPGLALLIFSLALTLIKRERVALVVMLWALLPLLVQMVFLKTFTGRYILSSIPPLLVLSAYGLNFLLTKLKFKIFSFLLLSILIPSLYFGYLLLTDPILAPIPKEARRGYFEEWTAGYGLKNIAAYLKHEAEKESIVVGTEGSFGTLPDGLQIYLDDYLHLADSNHQISIITGIGVINDSLYMAALKHPTFFVTNQFRFKKPPEAKLLLEFKKAAGEQGVDAMQLYQISPKNL